MLVDDRCTAEDNQSVIVYSLPGDTNESIDQSYSLEHTAGDSATLLHITEQSESLIHIGSESQPMRSPASQSQPLVGLQNQPQTLETFADQSQDMMQIRDQSVGLEPFSDPSQTINQVSVSEKPAEAGTEKSDGTLPDSDRLAESHSQAIEGNQGEVISILHMCCK